MAVERSRILPQLKSICSTCGLRQLCLPVGLAPGELERVDALITRRQHLPAGQHLYRQQDPFKALYAVRTGFLKTYDLNNEGGEQINGFHMSGELVGLDAISAERHVCNAVALEECEVCVIPFERLETLLQEIPSLMRQFHRLMSQEIAADHGMMMLLGTLSAEQKLAVFILNLSQRLHARGFSPTVFRLSMSREEIGNYLGLKLETVSRTFSKLQEDTLIAIDRRNLTIRDLPALERLAGCAARG